VVLPEAAQDFTASGFRLWYVGRGVDHPFPTGVGVWGGACAPPENFWRLLKGIIDNAQHI